MKDDAVQTHQISFETKRYELNPNSIKCTAVERSSSVRFYRVLPSLSQGVPGPATQLRSQRAMGSARPSCNNCCKCSRASLQSLDAWPITAGTVIWGGGVESQCVKPSAPPKKNTLGDKIWSRDKIWYVYIYIPGAWKLAQLGYPICNSILWSKELFLTQGPYFWKGPCFEPFRVEHLYDTGLYSFIRVKLGKHPHIVLFHCHSPWHSLVWPQDCFWLLMELWKC